jgi:hypothetical protein
VVDDEYEADGVGASGEIEADKDAAQEGVVDDEYEADGVGASGEGDK